MRFYNKQVVFQEVPNEISLAYSITGCNLRCKGCHSPFTWKVNTGTPLDVLSFEKDLEKYGKLISCVLFYGGEWHEDDLVHLLTIAKERYGLKTCLYTGLDNVPERIKEKLDFLKIGPWKQELGGLQSPQTNQQLIDLQNGESMNHYFTRQ